MSQEDAEMIIPKKLPVKSLPSIMHRLRPHPWTREKKAIKPPQGVTVHLIGNLNVPKSLIELLVLCPIMNKLWDFFFKVFLPLSLIFKEK